MQAKKIADILGVLPDFLMNDKAKEEAVIDNEMLYRMQEVQNLPESEKETPTLTIHWISTFITD